MPKAKWVVDKQDCFAAIRKNLKEHPGKTVKKAINDYASAHGLPFHKVNSVYYEMASNVQAKGDVEFTTFIANMEDMGNKVGIDVRNLLEGIYPLLKKSAEYEAIKDEYQQLKTEYAAMKENVTILNGMLEHFISLTALEKTTTIGDLVYKMRHTIDGHGMVVSVQKS